MAKSVQPTQGLNILHLYPIFCKKYFIIIILTWLIILDNSCMPKFPSHTPTTTNCTFVFNNIMSACKAHQTGTNIIPYNITLRIYFLNGSNKFPLSTLTQKSSGPQPWVNATMVQGVPNDGTPWSYQVFVTGTTCSLCALTQYGNDICNQIPIYDGNGNFLGTQAGVPTFFYNSAYYNTYKSTITVPQLYKGENQSCNNCVVPY